LSGNHLARRIVFVISFNRSFWRKTLHRRSGPISSAATRVASPGFNRISVTNYVSASDYCTQHYWRYLRANWILARSVGQITSKNMHVLRQMAGRSTAGKMLAAGCQSSRIAFCSAAGSRSQGLVAADGQSAGRGVAMSCVSSTQPMRIAQYRERAYANKIVLS
jgi:hypothetical protein